jgi:hypothetical protein
MIQNTLLAKIEGERRRRVLVRDAAADGLTAQTRPQIDQSAPLRSKLLRYVNT